jgi:hypothetical protein
MGFAKTVRVVRHQHSTVDGVSSVGLTYAPVSMHAREGDPARSGHRQRSKHATPHVLNSERGAQDLPRSGED